VVEKGTMPTTLSPVMNKILRSELSFDGLIVTDAMSMSGLTLYFTQEEASVRALEAGADLLLKPAIPMRPFADSRCGKERPPDRAADRRVCAKSFGGKVRSRTGATAPDALDGIDQLWAAGKLWHWRTRSQPRDHLVRNDDSCCH